MNFTNWLQNQQCREDSIGDLARDAAQDSGWPTEDDLNIYIIYLESQGACDGAMDAIRMAWDEYKKEAKSIERLMSW